MRTAAIVPEVESLDQQDWFAAPGQVIGGRGPNRAGSHDQIAHM